MSIRTVDTDAMAEKVGNLYEAVVIVSKRARQIAANTKAELDGRLQYFDDITLEVGDEIRTNEDQLRISLEFERRPKPTTQAIEELFTEEIYYRNPSAEEGGNG
jgi:DNA-directed RNA polymerase subunit K/omega